MDSSESTACTSAGSASEITPTSLAFTSSSDIYITSIWTDYTDIFKKHTHTKLISFVFYGQSDIN